MASKIMPQSVAAISASSTSIGSSETPRCSDSACVTRCLNDLDAPAFISFLIMLVGLGVGATILSLHIPEEVAAQTTRFDKIADEAFMKFESALETYKVSGLWLHQACHRKDMTFDEFREVYHYITSTGLQFCSISCSLRVNAADRPLYENQTRAYLAEHYPNYPYNGFSGYIMNDTTREYQLGVSPNASEYLVAHFVQPFENPWNLHNADLDMSTLQYDSKIVSQALQSGSLAVTERLNLLAPPTDPSNPYEYCLTMAQPGLGGKEDTDYSDNVAMIVIKFMSLLEAAYQNATVESDTMIYVYDSTPSVIEAGGEPAFFGGLKLGEVPLSFVQEVNYSSIQDGRINRRMERHIALAAREWTFVAVACPEMYKPDLFLAIFGAVMIIIASTCAALWIFSRSKAKADKAAILLDSAKKATLTERELNDFIAHEVRNPLSAAMSANSFVSMAVNEASPLTTDEARESIREDVLVIGNSLQYINDLLRSMLDFHCVLTKQMNVHMKHVDIRNDIFSPVASMLCSRGCVFDVVIDCPDDLVVMSDPLRLKQVILNLAANAIKFVTKGFVWLRAEEKDGAIQLFVEDSGPGIPHEKRSVLFKKFQPSLDSASQGTGIGLSLCKHLVELMDGDIHLDETFDSGIPECPGTRFVVTLKGASSQWDAYTEMTESCIVDIEMQKSVLMTATDCPMERANSVSATENGSSVTDVSETTLPEALSVLFVDDDFILRKLFVRSVKRCRPNWVVSEAASGEAAVQLIGDRSESKNPFDLVFLDQYMASTQKQLLGTETVRLLRARGFDAVVCGLSANDLGRQFIEAGADCFMMKPLPCDSSQLACHLNYVLASRNHKLDFAADQV